MFRIPTIPVISGNCHWKQFFYCSFFMTESERNSIVIKRVSELPFCMSCYFLNLERVPISPQPSCGLNQLYGSSATAECFQETQRTACQPGASQTRDNIEAGLLLLSSQTLCFPSCVVSTEVWAWREDRPPERAGLGACSPHRGLSKDVVEENT